MRPMLKRQEYRTFAEKINKRMEWKPYGIEMLTFYTVAVVAPPLAAFLMVRRHFLTDFIAYFFVLALFLSLFLFAFARSASSVSVVPICCSS